jgi:YD repeat-containing protein
MSLGVVGRFIARGHVLQFRWNSLGQMRCRARGWGLTVSGEM